jgi:hypothetical protein
MSGIWQTSQVFSTKYKKKRSNSYTCTDFAVPSNIHIAKLLVNADDTHLPG